MSSRMPLGGAMSWLPYWRPISDKWKREFLTFDENLRQSIKVKKNKICTISWKKIQLPIYNISLANNSLLFHIFIFGKMLTMWIWPCRCAMKAKMGLTNKTSVSAQTCECAFVVTWPCPVRSFARKTDHWKELEEVDNVLPTEKHRKTWCEKVRLRFTPLTALNIHKLNLRNFQSSVSM